MEVGVGDFREALDGDAAGAVDAEHVDEGDVAVDVLLELEEVVGVEGGCDVPPETVALGEQPLDQLRRLVDAVVFNVEDGVRATEDALRALKNAQFVALDVDLDQGYWRVMHKAVERAAGDGLG